MNYSWLEPALFLLFLAFSAFCSSSETAFTAVNRYKMKHLLNQKTRTSFQLEYILQHPKKLITAILVGNNIANIGASVMATTTLLDVFANMGIENLAIRMTLVTIITTLLILIFGEITPKTLTIKHPERVALYFAKPVYYMIQFFYPVVLFFNLISVGVSRLFGINSSEVSRVLTAEELKMIIKVGQEEGVLDKEEMKMLHSIFEFSDTIVREVMVPRTDAKCLDVNSSVPEAINLIHEKGHARIPVYDKSLDNIVGIVNARDLLGIHDDHHRTTLRKFMREPLFIPETASVEAVLHQMRRGKSHMAIVVDEYGGMSGIITMEDILEEIVGDIQDEFDNNENPDFIELSKDRYLVEASLNIDDLAEKLNSEFPAADDFDTIGGFVLAQLGRFPLKGEHLQYKNLKITVKDISRRRILRLEILKIGEAA